MVKLQIVNFISNLTAIKTDKSFNISAWAKFITVIILMDKDKALAYFLTDPFIMREALV